MKVQLMEAEPFVALRQEGAAHSEDGGVRALFLC